MPKQPAAHIRKETLKQKPKAKPASQGPGFLRFLIAKEQRIDWAIIGGLFIAILIYLKMSYPYPQTETDTGNYVLSAATGKINGYRPYGYSAFISFFHSISGSVTFVVTWQWLLTFLSTAWFIFSLKFIFRSLPAFTFYALSVICILNPSIIYMDSYLMSDSLFVSLTLLFLTSAIWIVFSRSWIAVIANLILMWYCIDTRYIGLFYPLFSAAALVWMLWPRFKWMSLFAAVLPLLMLYFYRANATDNMKEQFGVETFSAFSGWQKANNAVAVLPYVQVDPKEITDPQIRAIHQIVRQFPDSLFSTENVMATNFMWVKSYPGKTCLSQYIQEHRTQPNLTYLNAWITVGSQMQDYGDFLESHYSGAFFSHFIIPNIKNIFEVYEIMDLKDSVFYSNLKDAEGRNEYFTPPSGIYYYHSHFFKSLTGIRKVCDILVWLLLISSIIGGVVMQKKLNWTIAQKVIALSMVIFIGAFCGASVIAAPINNFRYMMPILYCQLAIIVLVISGIVVSMKKGE